MYTIEVRNVNEALPRGLRLLENVGVEESSRVGAVLAAPAPVLTIYQRPWERVLFSPERDANPFFHLFEALWMLAGRQDVAFPAHYAQQLQLYSDDNETLNGAYGFRWREHFGYDQVQLVIDELRNNPTSRRCVIAMWDALNQRDGHGYGYEGDLHRALGGGKDVPCNTHIYFRELNGALHMTVCNRSNDVVWGAYGANAVHFSMLHEYISLMVGVKMGHYYQFANNFHAYVERSDVKRLFPALDRLNSHEYENQKVSDPMPLFDAQFGHDAWHADLRRFMEAPTPEHIFSASEFRTRFFREVVLPMRRAHQLYKVGDIDALRVAIDGLRPSAVIDWIYAASRWLERRLAARIMKEARS